MIVRVRELGYRYPTADTNVLDGLDFEIGEGEVFGFLGPNGSGKSTTQKLLTRILRDYQGSIEAFGQPLDAQAERFHEQIGVCFEFPNLYEKLSATENLSFFAGFFDGETESPAALLERLDLPRGDTRPVIEYSKGMRMRVVLARSLVNGPRLWFLDEPTSGQDPEHAVKIRELVRERADAGTTVFLTTHDMTLADEICDRVALLSGGRLAACESPRALKLAHGDRVVRVELRTPQGPERRDFHLEVEPEKDAFLACVRDHEVETIHTLEPTLEDVFLRVTGSTLA